MPPALIKIAPRSSAALFASLAILMVISSYFLVILLSVACVYLPYLALSGSTSLQFQLIVLFFGGIAIAAAMLWSLLPRRDKFEAPGPSLDRAVHPKLFDELEAIAAALNEPVPREVCLLGQVNAFVADRGGIMGFGSRRVMGIGLPLLSILTVSELRGVLAHEFAHYYSGDTRLGPWVYKTQTTMIRTFENIGKLGSVGRIAVFQMMYLLVNFVLKQYFVFSLRVIHSVSRRQEYRADELAGLVAGAQPLVDGLRKIHGASLAWPVYWNTEVVPVLQQDCIPAVGLGFGKFLASPQIAVQVSHGIEQEILKGKATPYDTHPPLRDRVAALERLGISPREDDSEMASSLMSQFESAEIQFLEFLNPKKSMGSLRRVSWDEIAEAVTIPSWRSAVSEYASLFQGVHAESLPEVTKKFPEMASRIHDPKGRLLTPHERTQRVGHLFAMALGLALLEKGWKLEAQPGSFHLYRGAEKMDVVSVMDDLVTGKMSRDNWIALCNRVEISQAILYSTGTSAESGA
jgi:Zn-dependent protease with chaperone function